MHILIVDDEERLAHTLKKILEKNQYEVSLSYDGDQAQSCIRNQSFDLIISDIRMPGLDGVSLLKWLKSYQPDLPFILMTALSDIMEVQEAYDLGASAFLTKPFKNNEIQEAIETAVAKNEHFEEKEDAGKIDDEFIPINIEEFTSGNVIPYEIHIRLSSHKYIKVAHTGDDVDINQLKKYKEKGIQYLYLKKEDYLQYVGFAIELSQKLKKSNQIEKDKKQNFLKHTNELIVQRTFVEDVEENLFHFSKEYVSTNVAILYEDPKLKDFLETLNSHTNFLYAHSLGVSIYGIMIAKKIGWSSASTLFRISVGGLFHDIGKKEISEDILEKTRAHQTQKERKIYESHPERGFEIVKSIPHMSEDIAQMVHQHHEDEIGKGYPRGLTKNKIFPLAKVIALANEFCHFVIEDNQSHRSTAKEAVEKIEEEKEGKFNANMIDGLKKFILN